MIEHFKDPLLRAPMMASILMCISSSLIGVLIFLKKRSLLAETLSHAAYPGVALSILWGSLFSIDNSFLILTGAFISSLLGYLVLHVLERKAKLKEDSALSFVLSAFFGVGVFCASYVQYASAGLWQSLQACLYGKVATMTDIYIVIYGLLTAFTLFSIILFFKEIKVFLFDKNFALSLKLDVQSVEILFLFLSSLAVVIGMRTVGLILISAMLIAPAVFARAFTDRLQVIFLIAGCVGGFSAFFGNWLSLLLSDYYRQSIPTGPVIVLTASFFALGALLFAPKRGLVLRYLRILHFQRETLRENLLKMMWCAEKTSFSFSELSQAFGISKISLFFALVSLKQNKAVEEKLRKYQLSPLGKAMGAKIVRLHRLWEVYLVDYLGINAKRVHKNAEEIEHIITADLEKALIDLLDDPKHDPHDRPIPAITEKEAHVS